MKLIKLQNKLSDNEIQSKLEGRNIKNIILLKEVQTSTFIPLFEIKLIKYSSGEIKETMIAMLRSFDDAIRFIYDLFAGRFDGGIGNRKGFTEIKFKVGQENFNCMTTKSENLLHYTDIEDGIEIDI